MSGEEQSEGLVMPKVWVFNFAHVNAIDFGKRSVHDISEWLWNPQRANVSGDPRGNSSHGHNVFDLLVLFQGFVNLISAIPGCQNLTEEVLKGFLVTL